jgi:predicted AlkP superfamily phosphohydrolase/phosphomutase
VVIIGLDGGTWRLIEPMMERGELPNLQWFVRNGTSGPLTSLVPIESPRIWTSMATGKMPDKHGIDRFLVDRRFIRTATLWEIANAAGKRVGLYDWLVTYPPQALDGYVIPGWLAGGKSNTFPETLGRSLFVVRSLRHPFWFLGVAGVRLPLGYLEQARGNPFPRTINSQFVKSECKELDVPYLRAAHDTDLFAIVFYGSDVLAHSMWHLMEPRHFPDADPQAIARYGDAIPSYYRLVDRAIGTIREHYGDDTTFFIASDHGFRRAATVDRMDYIVADTLLSDMGLSGVAQNVGGAKDYAIIALKSPLGLSEREGRELRAKIIEALNRLESIEGKRIFQAAATTQGEEIRISFHPDVDLDGEHRIRIGEKTFPLEKYLQRAVLTGEHDLEGIFIAQGPGVRRNHRLSKASVVDVAPTVLYRLGLPVGSDMDGAVLAEVFTRATLEAQPIESIDSYDLHLKRDPPPDRPDVDPELMERLRSLGYLK